MDGSYVVKKAFIGGALILSEMDEKKSKKKKDEESKLKIRKGRLRFIRGLLELKTCKRRFELKEIIACKELEGFRI